MGPKYVPGGLLAPLGNLADLEAFWGGPGGLLGALGPVLEASWSALGRVLGALEPVLEAS